MEKINNFNGLNVFFIGIGGISMSALAQFCLLFGAGVSGSDEQINDETKKLSKMGACVFHGHNANNISSNLNYVVFSGAIHEDNVELKTARVMGLNVMERSEFLGVIETMFETSIVVSGTHGKTTTTALIGDVLMRAGLNPTIHVGGESVAFGNAKLGGKQFFVSEGCEYRNSIRFLKPSIGVITNIELDHTDFYKGYAQLEQAFLNFANSVRNTVVVFENNDFAKKITAKVGVITVGFDGDYDVVGKNVTLNRDGTYTFLVYYNGYVGKFTTAQMGFHNAKNALCAIAVGLVIGVDIGTIYFALREFKGVKRRLEKVGKINNTTVVCDYAHHPTEIASSIACIRATHKRILCVFQPHTFSRTIGLKEEFKKCFGKVEKLVIFKTYPARENYMVGGSARELFNEIPHKNKVYCDTIKQLTCEIKDAQKYDIVLVLGAGDIYDKIIKALKRI